MRAEGPHQPAGGPHDDILERYFRIETTPEDPDESNTIYLVNYMAVVRTFTYVFSKARISYDVLSPTFVKEVEEYAEAVLNGRRMLGVLFRGTDYTITFNHLPPQIPFAPVRVEDVIPVIRERLDNGHYDGIS